MGALKIDPEILAAVAREVNAWRATGKMGHVIEVQFAGRAAPVAEATTSTLLKGLLRGAGVVASVITLPSDQSEGERWKPYVEPPKPDPVCRVVDGHLVDEPSPADNLKFLTQSNQNLSPLTRSVLTVPVRATDSGYRDMDEADVELSNLLIRLGQLRAARAANGFALEAEIARLLSLRNGTKPLASGIPNPMASTSSSRGGSAPVSSAAFSPEQLEAIESRLVEKGFFRASRVPDPIDLMQAIRPETFKDSIIDSGIDEVIDWLASRHPDYASALQRLGYSNDDPEGWVPLYPVIPPDFDAISKRSLVSEMRRIYGADIFDRLSVNPDEYETTQALMEKLFIVASNPPLTDGHVEVKEILRRFAQLNPTPPTIRQKVALFVAIALGQQLDDRYLRRAVGSYLHDLNSSRMKPRFWFINGKPGWEQLYLNLILFGNARIR